jgi:hypothetical protein
MTARVAIRNVRDRYLANAKVKNPPTTTLVQVSALFRPEFLIEIEAVAWPSGRSLADKENGTEYADLIFLTFEIALCWSFDAFPAMPESCYTMAPTNGGR